MVPDPGILVSSGFRNLGLSGFFGNIPIRISSSYLGFIRIFWPYPNPSIFKFHPDPVIFDSSGYFGLIQIRVFRFHPNPDISVSSEPGPGVWVRSEYSVIS